MNEILHSQLFTGGFLLMVSGAAMALLRNIPVKLWYWLKDQFCVTLTVFDADPIFESLVAWLDAHPYSKRTRRLSVSTLRDDDAEASERILFSPGTGNHLLRHNGRLVWLNRNRDTAPAAPGQRGRAMPIETITLTVLGRSQQALREILGNSAELLSQRQQERVSVYLSEYGYWKRLKGTRKRPLESVVLPAGVTEKIAADVQKFLGNRDFYLRSSIPWRRGYLLTGLPGTGKTSLVAALASHLGLNLYVLPLSSPDMNDQNLFNLLLNVRSRSIVLLEDIDTIKASRSRTEMKQQSATTPQAADESRGVTLSGLLNCLDGIGSQEGCLTFMTTNHEEALDSALLRPGRVDMRIEFGHAHNEQIVRAYQRFFPDSNGDAAKFAQRFPSPVVMAFIQEELMALSLGGRCNEAI